MLIRQTTITSTLLTLALAVLPAGAYAAEGHGAHSESGAAARRPTELEHLRTNTAYMVHPGGAELDVLTSFDSFQHEDELEVLAELEIGVTEDLTVEIGVPFMRLSPRPVHEGTEGGGHTAFELAESHAEDADAGLGNVEAEAKYRLFDSGSAAGALLGAVVFPTATVGHGDLWEFIVATPLSMDVEGTSLGIHLEPGSMFVEGEGFARGYANLALDYYACPAGAGLQLALNSRFGDGNTEVSLVPGISADLEEMLAIPLQIAVGVPIGLNDAAQDWGALFDIQLTL